MIDETRFCLLCEAISYYFMECLIEAGIKAGLMPDMVRTLVVQTCYGSAKLALQSDRSFEQLRIDVTSPGGTTDAALKVLMQDDKLFNLMIESVEAADNRFREFSRTMNNS